MFSWAEAQAILEGAPWAARSYLERDPVGRRAAVRLLDRTTDLLVREGVWTTARRDMYLAGDVDTRINQWASGQISAEVGGQVVPTCEIYGPDPTGTGFTKRQGKGEECRPPTGGPSPFTFWDFYLGPITGGSHRYVAEGLGAAGAGIGRALGWIIGGAIGFLLLIVLVVVGLVAFRRRS